jgi:hypothetical protein
MIEQTTVPFRYEESATEILQDRGRDNAAENGNDD